MDVLTLNRVLILDGILFIISGIALVFSPTPQPGLTNPLPALSTVGGGKAPALHFQRSAENKPPPCTFSGGGRRRSSGRGRGGNRSSGGSATRSRRREARPSRGDRPRCRCAAR